MSQPCIEFGLSEDPGVGLSLQGMQLIRNGAQVVPLTGLAVAFDTATKRFSLDMRGVALPDGDYELRILPEGVTDIAGNALDIDGDNIADAGTGKFISIGFFKLTGDANADRAVDALDMLVVRKALGASTGQPAFDLNGDLAGLGNGAVNAADMDVVTANLGHTVQPLAPARIAVLESSGTPNDNAINFGQADNRAAPPAPVDITIRNNGQKPLTIAALQLIGANPYDFSFEIPGDEAGATGFVIPGGQTRIVRVHFTAGQMGDRSAQLRFWHNDTSAASPSIISLSAQTTGAVSGAISSAEALADDLPVAGAGWGVSSEETLALDSPAAIGAPAVAADEVLAPLGSANGSASPAWVSTSAPAGKKTAPAAHLPSHGPARPAPVKRPAPRIALGSATAHASLAWAAGSSTAANSGHKPPANPASAILTGRLVARAPGAAAPSTLFAAGKPKKSRMDASSVLNSVPTKPAPQSKPERGKAFNASRRIK